MKRIESFWKNYYFCLRLLAKNETDTSALKSLKLKSNGLLKQPKMLNVEDSWNRMPVERSRDEQQAFSFQMFWLKYHIKLTARKK